MLQHKTSEVLEYVTEVRLISRKIYAVTDVTHRISSPISLVIFSVFDTEICEIFHEKRGSAYSRGFGIPKNLLNSVVLLFFFFFGTTRVRSKVSNY